MLNSTLVSIPIEDKAAIFDNLVHIFQGKGKFIGYKHVTKEVQTGPNETKLVIKDVPIYEFILRVDGHNDFLSALLALVKKPT